MERRSKYSKEYKQDALGLAERIGFPQAAKDLGIDKSMLYQWRKAVQEAEEKGIKAFPGQGIPRDEELHYLRKRVKDLEETNEILKKAAIIFAKKETR